MPLAGHDGRCSFRGSGFANCRRTVCWRSLCTADRAKVDKRTRSKWSRVMRYAAEYKTNAEPLADLRSAQGWHQQMCRAIYPLPRARGPGRMSRCCDGIRTRPCVACPTCRLTSARNDRAAGVNERPSSRGSRLTDAGQQPLSAGFAQSPSYRRAWPTLRSGACPCSCFYQRDKNPEQ